MDNELKIGKWHKQMGNLLNGKKVGIVGFGRIGQKVAALMAGFGVEIAYYDVEEKLSNLPAKLMPKEDILRWADIVTLHCNMPADSGYLLGKREFEILKDGGWVINTSRGELIDENALYNALKSGKLSGAALDVFSKEPYDGKLKELDNVITTPHIGSYARESRIQMEIQAVENLLKALND
jgi:D-3-phosphoglycerate dehydrogenase